MRTIDFNNEDIKQCKLALVNQNLTSLQSAFLMQYITNLEQALNEIREYIESIKDEPDADMYIKLGDYKEFQHILQIIDKFLGDEK